MSNNYQFLDAYGSVQTAATSIVNGAHQPLIQVASIVGGLPVTFSGSPSVSGAFTLVGGFSSVSGVGLFNTNHVGSGSILTIVPGSVATVPAPGSVSGVGVFNVNPIGNGSVITVPQPASVSGVGLFNVNHVGNGSVITVFSSPSIVGTYAEDSGHIDGDKGFFVLGVRNDNVSSFASANLDYTPHGLDAAGRVLVKPFAPEESRISGYSSVNGTSVTTAISAPGTGLRNYITDVEVANTGSVATLVTFQDGAASVIGFTIAPATGGSNIVGMAMPMRTGTNTTFDFKAATAASTLYVTARGFKAP